MLSVDLFTGIGGFVLGLEGVCKPIVYCDKSPVVLRILDKLMLEGAVPKAKIVDDVTKLPEILRAVNSRKVDMITAGFPCVGFSDFGRREGLSDERSGLFHAAMKVVRALRPTFVFFENVHKVINSNGGRDFKVIMSSLNKSGYDCRWTTCKATDVGIPQKRKRWFCLCVLRGRQVPKLNIPASKIPTLSKMPKLLAQRAPDYSERYFVLGNSIVPAVAKFAFERLVRGFRDSPMVEFAEIPENILSSVPTLHGFSVKGKIRWVNVKSIPEPPYNIVLDPKHYAPVYKPMNLKNRAAPVLATHSLSTWPTPRATAWRHSNSLSVRNVRDLPTAALFASKVQGVSQPKAIQGMSVNPKFIEWLMGFPIGWTSA